MLRFLIDLRGEEVDNTQMRDDLITLLIAGHETTAAVLTWLVYALSQHPEALKVVQQEIDEVVGDRYASGRASDREPAWRRTATPLLTHPALLLRPQVRDGRGHQEDARGAESDRRDASHVVHDGTRLGPGAPPHTRAAHSSHPCPPSTGRRRRSSSAARPRR